MPRYEDKELKLDDNFNLLECIDGLVEKSARAAVTLRTAVSDIYTNSDIGVYWHPEEKKAAVYVRVGTGRVSDLDQAGKEAEWCLDAISEKIGEDHVVRDLLEESQLRDPWVKVAYSPTLRKTLNALQFLPDSKNDAIGGRPLASTLATGLLGAGLGYGGGWLYDKLMPEKYRKKGRAPLAGAIIGGLGGAGIGAVPGLINMHEGRGFNDNHLWRGQPGDGWEGSLATSKEASAISDLLEKRAYSTMGGPSLEQMPLINTDRLGRVIYESGVGPQTAAQTMGVVYGASRMPDPNARPGIVTPNQTGLLGMAMGAAGGGVKGYATGWAVGKGLGLLTGLPAGAQKTFSRTGAAIGVMNTLVPRLFQ